jgi:hypothetical protein
VPGKGDQPFAVREWPGKQVHTRAASKMEAGAGRGSSKSGEEQPESITAPPPPKAPPTDLKPAAGGGDTKHPQDETATRDAG